MERRKQCKTSHAQASLEEKQPSDSTLCENVCVLVWILQVARVWRVQSGGRLEIQSKGDENIK